MDAFAGGDGFAMQDGLPRLYHYKGDHVLHVIEIKTGPTQDGRVWYGADLEVAWSNNEHLLPGTMVSWSTIRSQFPSYYFSEIRKFLHIVFGQTVPAPSITEAMMKASCTDDQPYAGVVIGARVAPKYNKKDGQPVIKDGVHINGVEFAAVKCPEDYPAMTQQPRPRVETAPTVAAAAPRAPTAAPRRPAAVAAAAPPFGVSSARAPRPARSENPFALGYDAAEDAPF